MKTPIFDHVSVWPTMYVLIRTYLLLLYNDHMPGHWQSQLETTSIAACWWMTTLYSTKQFCYKPHWHSSCCQQESLLPWASLVGPNPQGYIWHQYLLRAWWHHDRYSTEIYFTYAWYSGIMEGQASNYCPALYTHIYRNIERINLLYGFAQLYCHCAN